MTTPPGFATVTPYIITEASHDYCAFLAAAFAAEEIGRHVIEGRVANAMLRIGNNVVMVADAVPGHPATRANFYLYVADADAAMAQALAAGADVVGAISDKPYGDRQGGVRDPAGNVWWISQRLVAQPYY